MPDAFRFNPLPPEVSEEVGMDSGLSFILRKQTNKQTNKQHTVTREVSQLVSFREHGGKYVDSWFKVARSFHFPINCELLINLSITSQLATYLESEYLTSPIGVPAFPDISGIFASARAFSRIGIPTVSTKQKLADHSLLVCMWGQEKKG